jgi:hypothetical protein
VPSFVRLQEILLGTVDAEDFRVNGWWLRTVIRLNHVKVFLVIPVPLFVCPDTEVKGICIAPLQHLKAAPNVFLMSVNHWILRMPWSVVRGERVRFVRTFAANPVSISVERPHA